MAYGWDSAKNASNIVKHGVGFDAVESFDWATAVIRADTRENYGEVRLRALGAIGERLFLITYTIRRTVWIISVRPANRKETKFYASES